MIHETVTGYSGESVLADRLGVTGTDDYQLADLAKSVHHADRPGHSSQVENTGAACSGVPTGRRTANSLATKLPTAASPTFPSEMVV